MAPPRARERTLKSRLKVPLAIAAAGILVVSGFLLVGPIASRLQSALHHGSSAPKGPPISVHSFTLLNGVATPVSAANVTIMSPDPLAVGNPAWAGINITSAITSDAGEIFLLNGTTGSNGVFQGNLPPSFTKIAQEWTSYLYQPTHVQNVSLQVYGVYTNVSSTGVQRVYSFYNNIPYNPWNPPTNFSITVSFDLAHPIWTSGGAGQSQGSGNLSSEVTPDRSICPTNKVNWVVLGSTNDTGPYPIAMANDSDPTATNDYLSLSTFSASATWSLYWNSITVSGTTQSVEMSSSPSYTGSGNAYSASQTSCAANYLTSASICMIYLDSVTIWTFRFQMQAIYYSGYTCHAYSYKTNYLTMEVTKINGGPNGNGGTALYSVHAAGENSYFGEIIQKISDRDQALGYTGTLAATNSTTFSTMQSSSTQYSNAGSALTNFVNAFSYFDSALGLGLAVIDAANVCGAACSAADVISTLGLLSAAAGFAASIYPLLSSISLSITTNLYLNAESVTNAKWAFGSPGVSYSVFLNESASSVQLVCSLNTYYPYMPGLMAIACAYGSSPGNGC